MKGLESFFNKIKEVKITVNKVYKKSWLKIKLRDDIPNNLDHKKIMLNGVNNDIFFMN